MGAFVENFEYVNAKMRQVVSQIVQIFPGEDFRRAMGLVIALHYFVFFTAFSRHKWKKCCRKPDGNVAYVCNAHKPRESENPHFVR
jgi:hypothetical protein